MLPFLHRRNSLPGGVDYAQEWIRVQNRYADPMTEHAKTLQELVVSATSVIDRVWNGNGGTGWDESCEEEFIRPLKAHLPDSKVFSAAQCREITSKLEEIVSAGRENLKRIAEAETRDEETTLCFPSGAPDYIVRRTVDWCAHYPAPISIRDEEEYHGHY